MSNQREDGLAPSPSSSSSYPVMSSTGNGPAGSNGGSVNESIMDETAASLAAGLTSDAKNLINSLLGTRGGESGGRDQNLQILSMAAAANSSQKPPPAKNTSSSPAPGPVTTPTQVTPVSTRKRGRLPVADHDDSVKRRKCAPSSGGGRGAPTSEKQSKGLRHFSQLVCEKVREKGRTTYNEVADELVKEFGEAERRSGQDGQIDQKNIRRRVYDALNVLMAMNIINKEKKDIHWIGLPTNSVQECEHIQMELSQQEERISKKTSELHDLVLQILTLKNLIKRNRDKAAAGESPSQNSAIGLPFILVNTNKNTTIDCSISSDKSEYVFTFDNTFELHQDVDILNKMDLDCGLNSGKVSTRSIAEAKATLPKIFEPVIDDMAVLSRTIPQSPPAATLFEPPPPVSVAATPTSTQSSIQPPSLPTPLLSDHSNGSFSNLSASSPLAIAAAALVNSHNPVSVAAAITQLQQLQQASSLPPTTSPSSSSFLRGGTVTARPLNFTSSPRPQSSPGLLGVKGHSSQSPKVVTVQPLPNSVTSKMAEVIASLQSSILMQQQQQYAMGGAATPLNSAQSENVIPSIASLSDELPSSKTQGGGVTATIDESEQVSTSSVLTPSNPPVSLST